MGIGVTFKNIVMYSESVKIFLMITLRTLLQG